MAKTPAIVTRDSIKAMLANPDPKKVAKVVGRALLVLLERQTADERAAAATVHHNGMGFAGLDAEIGTSHAEFFKRTGFLTGPQVAVWTRNSGKSGYPRIAKYHAQLNEAALAKAAAKQAIAA